MYKAKLISNNEVDFKNHTFGGVTITNFKSNLCKKIRQMDSDQINDFKLIDIDFTSKNNQNSGKNNFSTPKNHHKKKVNGNSETKLLPFLKTLNKTNQKVIDELKKRNKEIAEQIRKLIPDLYRKNKMRQKLKDKQNNNIRRKSVMENNYNTFITKMKLEEKEKINRYKSGVNMHFLKNHCDNIRLDSKSSETDRTQRKKFHSKKMDLLSKDNYKIFKNKYLYTIANEEEEIIDKNIEKLIHKNEVLSRFLNKKKKGSKRKKQILNFNKQFKLNEKDKNKNNNNNFITYINNNNIAKNSNQKDITHIRSNTDINENIINIKNVVSNYPIKNIFSRKNSKEESNLYFENTNKNTINNDISNSKKNTNKNFALSNSTTTFNKFNKTSTADTFNQTLSTNSYNNTKNNLYYKTFLSNSVKSNNININNSAKILNSKSHDKFKNKTLNDIRNLLSEFNLELDPCFLKDIKDKTRLKHFLYYFKIMNVEHGINQNYVHNNDKIKERKNVIIKMKNKCKTILSELDNKNNFNLDKFVIEYKKSDLDMTFPQYYNYLLTILQNYDKKVVPNTFEIKNENKGQSDDLKYSTVVQKHRHFIKILDEQVKEGQYANKLVENFINKAEKYK